jgi:hypothetical protein
MKTVIMLAATWIVFSVSAQNSFGDIIGTFVTKENKEGIYGAYAVTSRGNEIFKSVTDEDGRFRISAVPAGEYQVYLIDVDGDTTYVSELVEVTPNGYGNTGDVVQNKTELGPVVVYSGQRSLRLGVLPEFKLTAKEIKHMANKFDAKKMISSMTTDVRLMDDGSLVFRGARKGDVINYLDGVKMTDVQNVPSASLGYIMVYSGAIPAKYGDTTGGVVVMETKSYFDLLQEYEMNR